MLDFDCWLALVGLRFAGGVKAAGGITLDDQGLKITAGGATVTAGGVVIAGGITLDDSGLTITAGGIKAAGGMTLDDSGLTVTAGGSGT